MNAPTDHAEITALFLTEGCTANALHVVRVMAAFGDIVTECAAEAGLNRGILLEGCARYLARAMATGSACEETDLIAAVAVYIGGVPDSFCMRVFGACCEVFDGHVVWSDTADRYVLDLSEAA